MPSALQAPSWVIEAGARCDHGPLASSARIGPFSSEVRLAGNRVLVIAQADAARVYLDLSTYRIQLVLEEDGWHVDYELKGPKLRDGDVNGDPVYNDRIEQSEIRGTSLPAVMSAQECNRDAPILGRITDHGQARTEPGFVVRPCCAPERIH
jgi:hypothetical protein